MDPYPLPTPPDPPAPPPVNIIANPVAEQVELPVPINIISNPAEDASRLPVAVNVITNPAAADNPRVLPQVVSPPSRTRPPPSRRTSSETNTPPPIRFMADTVPEQIVPTSMITSCSPKLIVQTDLSYSYPVSK